MSETAEILRVSTKTVYKLIKENKLPAVKVGREKRIAKKLLIDYLTNGSQQHSNPDLDCSEKTSDNVWTLE